MATSKSIRESMPGTVYRSGKPVPAAPAAPAAVDPQAESVWNWLPKHRRDLLLDISFAAVRRANTPPAGEPFMLDGSPYATPVHFAEELAEEFREQLYRLIKARGEGPYYTLKEALSVLEEHPQ